MTKQYVPIYKVSDAMPYNHYGEHRARVKLLSPPHKGLGLGGKRGDWVITSDVKFADYKRGIIVTRNSIYIWRV